MANNQECVYFVFICGFNVRNFFMAGLRPYETLKPYVKILALWCCASNVYIIILHYIYFETMQNISGVIALPLGTFKCLKFGKIKYLVS